MVESAQIGGRREHWCPPPTFATGDAKPTDRIRLRYTTLDSRRRDAMVASLQLLHGEFDSLVGVGCRIHCTAALASTSDTPVTIRMWANCYRRLDFLGV